MKHIYIYMYIYIYVCIYIFICVKSDAQQSGKVSSGAELVQCLPNMHEALDSILSGA